MTLTQYAADWFDTLDTFRTHPEPCTCPAITTDDVLDAVDALGNAS